MSFSNSNMLFQFYPTARGNARCFRHPFVFLVSLVVLFQLQPPRTIGQELSDDTMVQEIFDAYRRMFNEFEFSYAVLEIKREDAEPVKLSISRKGKKTLYTEEHDQKIIRCVGDGYSFELVNAEDGSRWLLGQIVDHNRLPNDPRADSVARAIDIRFMQFFSHLLIDGEYSATSLLENKSVLQELKFVKTNKGTMLIRFPIPASTKITSRTLSGIESEARDRIDESIVRNAELEAIDDDGAIRILRTRYELSKDSFRRGEEIVFRDFLSRYGVDFPTAWEVTTFDSDSGESTIEIRFTSIEFGKPIADRTFRISTYGLPEPGWYRPPPPYWLYVSIVGMILLVIGAMLLRYGKRLWRIGSAK